MSNSLRTKRRPNVDDVSATNDPARADRETICSRRQPRLWRMVLKDHLTVTVRVPEGDPLGDAGKRIRTWLDSQKIQIATFATAADAKGYTFTISFMDASDADQFASALKVATGVADVATG